MTRKSYKRKPYRFENHVPVFVKNSFYKTNYEKISKDHLISEMEFGKNPFNEKSLLEELENKTFDVIKKYNQKHFTILDAGLGNGEILSKLKNTQKYGVDISLNYLKNAQDDIITCCADLEDLPYNDNFFDLIICTDVLEHVLHLENVIQEISRVLKSDGILILRVPLNENLNPYLGNKDYDFVHLRSFSKESLILMLTKIWKFKIFEINEIGKSFSFMKYKKANLPIWNQDTKNTFNLNQSKQNIFWNELFFNLRSLPKIISKCLFCLNSIQAKQFILNLYEKRSNYLLTKICDDIKEMTKNSSEKINDNLYFEHFEGTEVIISLKKCV